jgi:hypothetical protein
MARPCEKKKRGGEEKWCFSLGFAKRQEGRGRKDIIHLILTKRSCWSIKVWKKKDKGRGRWW